MQIRKNYKKNKLKMLFCWSVFCCSSMQNDLIQSTCYQGQVSKKQYGELTPLVSDTFSEDVELSLCDIVKKFNPDTLSDQDIYILDTFSNEYIQSSFDNAFPELINKIGKINNKRLLSLIFQKCVKSLEKEYLLDTNITKEENKASAELFLIDGKTDQSFVNLSLLDQMHSLMYYFKGDKKKYTRLINSIYENDEVLLKILTESLKHSILYDKNYIFLFDDLFQLYNERSDKIFFKIGLRSGYHFRIKYECHRF